MFMSLLFAAILLKFSLIWEFGAYHDVSDIVEMSREILANK